MLAVIVPTFGLWGGIIDG